MFDVEIDDVKYRVDFEHVNPANDFIGEIKYHYGTSCFIMSPNGTIDGKPRYEMVAHGDTYLHPLDYCSYDKDFGRKESLTSALLDTLDEHGDRVFDKVARATFWKAYRATRGKW